MRWLALLLAVSCGPTPGQDIDMEIVSKWTDHVVTVIATQQPREGATLDAKYGDTSLFPRTILNSKQLQISESFLVKRAIPNANTQARLLFGINATAVGQSYPFTVTTDFPGTLTAKNRIVFTFDFDSSGGLGMKYEWK